MSELAIIDSQNYEIRRLRSELAEANRRAEALQAERDAAASAERAACVAVCESVARSLRENGLREQAFGAVDCAGNILLRMLEDAAAPVPAAVLPGKAVGAAAPVSQGVPEGFVTQDFPIIPMGLGKVEVGDAEWEGLPSLWFGRGGRGLDAPTQEMNRPAREGETLAMFTFADIRGLDAVDKACARLRAKMLSATPQPPAHDVSRLQAALAEIREVWAGAEAGEPVYAQEAYALRLCKQMAEIACAALQQTSAAEGEV